MRGVHNVGKAYVDEQKAASSDDAALLVDAVSLTHKVPFDTRQKSSQSNSCMSRQSSISSQYKTPSTSNSSNFQKSMFSNQVQINISLHQNSLSRQIATNHSIIPCVITAKVRVKSFPITCT